MNHDTAALTAAARQVIDDARRLGLTWTLQNASVVTATPLGVQMDGDNVTIAAISMVGAVGVGLRVYVIQVPPGGNYIVGYVGATKIPGLAGNWNAMTLLNGWTNVGTAEVTAQYRMVASPPNTLQIVGEIAAGTLTDGTAVTNLPGGFRPIHSTTFPVGCNPTARAAVMRYTATGDLVIFGFIAGTVQAYFNTLIPLDA
jgi:hypothetical protein